MLVLSRKQGEVICIGDDIYVEVAKISPKEVRLGITAPKNVEVHRLEVKEKIARGKEAAK